jgi:hypothetical protein
LRNAAVDYRYKREEKGVKPQTGFVTAFYMEDRIFLKSPT